MATKHRTGHLFKRGKNFYVRWVVEKKVFSKALKDDCGKPITRLREAEEARVKVLAPFMAADEVTALESIAGKLAGRKAELAEIEDKLNPPLPLSRAWTEYVNSANRSDPDKDTLDVYEGQFGQFVDWMAQNHPDRLLLRDVTENVAETYAGHLNHGRLSPNTFNKHIRVLKMVFRVLSKKAKLSENPWEAIRGKKLNTKSRRELTMEELRKVCQSTSGEFRVLFGFGVYTGLRLKDCASLQWSEVDLERNVITRVPSKSARRNPKPVLIPIHPELRKLLLGLEGARNGYVLPGFATQYLAGKTSKRRIINRIQNHFLAQGIQIHEPGTGPGTGKRAVVVVGFHSLRHTFVSLCREADAPLAVVESIVGHSSPAMTRHYTHVGEIAAGQAVAALPAVMENSTLPAPTAKRDPAAILREIKTLVQGLTPENCNEQRQQILALIPE